jgi:2-polyprenyl-3-methyl-5-hydroxy-6-metoxy-1,4-benzoquinol methylase
MKCRICGNTENNIVYSVNEMMFGTDELFEYFECSFCKCLQIAGFPEQMSKYYPSDYYSYQPVDEAKFKGLSGTFKLRKYQSSLSHTGLINKLFRYLYNETWYDPLSRLSLNKDAKILDVGTGNGGFLYPLQLMGFKNVLGIDPFLAKRIEYNSGLVVESKSIFEIKPGWDLITYNHVFEHLEKPEEELKRIFELLNPNGICLVSIPTVSSYVWRKFRVHWYQIDAPRHFFLHSIQSLRILAEKAGFKVGEVHYNANLSQIYYSELNKSGIPFTQKPKIKGFRKIGWKVRKCKYKKITRILNKRELGDQFSVVLYKGV